MWSNLNHSGLAHSTVHVNSVSLSTYAMSEGAEVVIANSPIVDSLNVFYNKSTSLSTVASQSTSVKLPATDGPARLPVTPDR